MNNIIDEKELSSILLITMAKLEAFLINAFKCESLEEIKDLISNFNYFKNENELSGEFINLFDSVWAEMTHIKFSFINNNKSEFTLHKFFRENLSEILPGAIIVDKKNDRNNIPDFWIEYENEEIPVEIKRFVFNDSARDQLSRYMKYYNCNRGIAVAPFLKTDLPDSMIFLSVNIN